MATIRIVGLDKLERKIGKVQAQNTLIQPMRRAVLRVQNKMADYPQQDPAANYRRTGTLGRRWTSRVEFVHGDVKGRIGNNTEYAPWVQSAYWQAWMHKGRWQTDEQVLEDQMPVITRDFQRAVNEALGE